MTTLHDRLSDLADEAPPGGRPGDLWATGRRVHRRRRAGTAAIVVVAVAMLGTLAGLSWSQGRVSVQPAGADTPLGMPSQIWAASEHLPGTDDTGPIGPLVAVVPTVRSGWSGQSRNGILGISATGRYAFLDLPGRGARGAGVGNEGVAISDDGRFVAYWRTGSTSGTPGDSTGDPVTGVGVYDAMTGDAYRYDVATEHGLQPETLLWTGDRVTFDVWQLDAPRDDGVSASRREVVAWDPVSDGARVWSDQARDIHAATSWNGELVVTNRKGEVLHGDPGHLESFGRVDWIDDPDTGRFLLPGFHVSPDGTQVAAQTLNEPTQGPVLTGTLGSSTADVIRLAPLPSGVGRGDYLQGWRGDDDLVVYENGLGTGEGTYLTVDVTTGRSEILGYAEGPRPQLAADALAGPVFEAPEPPRPWNPFLVYGGCAAIMLAAALALRWWRRRVQR